MDEEKRRFVTPPTHIVISTPLRACYTFEEVFPSMPGLFGVGKEFSEDDIIEHEERLFRLHQHLEMAPLV